MIQRWMNGNQFDVDDICTFTRRKKIVEIYDDSRLSGISSVSSHDRDGEKYKSHYYKA